MKKFFKKLLAGFKKDNTREMEALKKDPLKQLDLDETHQRLLKKILFKW